MKRSNNTQRDDPGGKPARSGRMPLIVRIPFAGNGCLLVSGVLAAFCASAFTPAHAQAPPASSVHVAPGVVRPGETADEADMTRRPNGIDAEFVDKAGIVGKTALEASQLALDRSSNPDVKAFARRMVDDHVRMAAELRRLGAQKGLPVQTRMLVDPGLTALRTMRGDAFDKGYIALAGPNAHEAAIRVYEAEARNGHDPQLRAFAADTLSTLKAHLRAARALERSIAAAH
ncbi:membrane protein [Burkholderia diffusa]|uniref:Membrane protein n=2 Tax=Burkholderia diffusa TaxID=488732 RepID=A0A6P2J8M1_9BURK|nr:DUF4142 domain-containing protein [Burkholderia diffusa]VWB40326.1 membrane protein [Burkholderia diffusa]